MELFNVFKIMGKSGGVKNSLIDNKLKEMSSLHPEELYEILESREIGLTTDEAIEKIDEYGKNMIVIESKNTAFTRLREAVINPFNIVLLVIALITLLTDVVFADTSEYLTFSIIVSLVVISSSVAFIQGERSNKTAEKLTKMISNKVDVKRDGFFSEKEIEEITVGDIIKLSAGDMLPADVRFLSAKDVFIAQAALTGESNPVEKFSSVKNESTTSLTDLENIGFMGSNIVSGSATAIVISVGNDTYFGSMAQSLSTTRAKNSFEKGVDSVSKLLINCMIVMVPLIFIINGITKGGGMENPWLTSLLFAVSIAVGLTPEMLPVIMTSTLAKGAISMSKHKVIVKNLGSIQAFGEMDILCTDKTGTLTEDKIILEKYINVHGEDDSRILRHAYLNSHFQTGLKNLIDLAIINRATENNLNELLDKYVCVDEIPFDFARRRMSVVLMDKTGKSQLITKGAVEEVISICKFVEHRGEVVELNDALKEEAMKVYQKYNSEGLRMVAVAQRNNVADTSSFSVEDESKMVLIGFVGFLDPPKESAAAAIRALNDHGVRVVVLTGDSEGVALKVCSKVDLNTEVTLTGTDVERMNDEELKSSLRNCNLFSKLSPSQKQRVVAAFQDLGHTVGYLGDGINDALPLKQSDVGVSVDSAVDIAKETADIILLEKDLMVLEEGVIEGRKTFGNIIKYIKMAASGNFGNMFSVVIASLFLPFLPMMPIQILVQNLICDFSQMGMPFDSVDKEYLHKPRKWDAKSIKAFMMYLGPLSSIFDILCFVVMFFIIKANTADMAPLFQAGWFVFGTVSQILVIYMIRTSKIPFIQSRASIPLVISTVVTMIVAITIAFTGLAALFDMHTLPVMYIPWLAVLLTGYCLSTQLIKKIYVRKYHEWL